jgi:F-type H+-transporting ATPase subunit delta
MVGTQIAARYASALLQSVVERGTLTAVSADAAEVLGSLERSPELAAFLAHPLVDDKTRQQTVERIFGGRTDAMLIQFLQLMARRRRGEVIGSALRQFLRLAEERAGRGRAQVQVATALTPAQEHSLRRRLSGLVGQEVCLEVRVDPAIIGGLVVRVGDQVYDGSLASQLRRLHRRMLAR